MVNFGSPYNCTNSRWLVTISGFLAKGAVVYCATEPSGAVLLERVAKTITGTVPVPADA